MGSAPSTARGRALVQARKAADDIGSRGARGAEGDIYVHAGDRDRIPRRAVHARAARPAGSRRTADGAVADRRSRAVRRPARW